MSRKPGTELESILSVLSLKKQEQDIQRIQTKHRLRLVDYWGISAGARILEIGCGQGDTTVVLAHAAGEKGVVVGIDRANENYGSPTTLGKARNRLLQSSLGNRIRMEFDVDILDPSVTFADQEFDWIVFSHCLWYFSSYTELVAVLKRVSPWGKTLCLAEWNPHLEVPEQLAYYHAVTIQAMCESFHSSGHSNIRTLFYPEDIERALLESGWHLEKKTNIHSPSMQDAVWEVDTTIRHYPDIIGQLESMPLQLKQLLQSQITSLKTASNIRPMPVLALTATHLVL